MEMRYPRLEVISHEETREVLAHKDETGRVTSLVPVEGSDRAFLTLKLREGVTVRAEIPHEQMEDVLDTLYYGGPRDPAEKADEVAKYLNRPSEPIG